MIYFKLYTWHIRLYMYMCICMYARELYEAPPGIPQSSEILKIGCDSILKYQEALGLLDDVTKVPWENVVIKWVACGDKKPLK